MPDDLHLHDRGLAFDLSTLLARRRALQLLGGAGLATLIGCGSSGGDAASTASSLVSSSGSTTSASSSSATEASSSSTATSASCSTIPEETAGPYPGDGSNGPNVLTQSGVVRSDIRSSFGTSTITAPGVPLVINLQLQDASSCNALAGGAVYLWHCTRDGGYSLYSQGVTGENFLRGVQAAGSDGKLTFTSIFPGAYSGRWPHIHFEVYSSLTDATAVSKKVATSQIALPKDVCDTVYATDGYSASVRNLAQTSLQRDMVFSDGYDLQLPTVSGDVNKGITIDLSVAV
jgi:protocatechuate 3,4-dioxygenase beta subunit